MGPQLMGWTRADYFCGAKSNITRLNSETKEALCLKVSAVFTSCHVLRVPYMREILFLIFFVLGIEQCLEDTENVGLDVIVDTAAFL